MHATYEQERPHLQARFPKKCLYLLQFLDYSYMMCISKSKSIMPPKEGQSCTGTSTPLDVNVLKQAHLKN